MGRIIIAQATILSLPALSRLFAHAVESHFTYFPDHIQRRMITDHNVRKLLLATIDPRRIILTARTSGQIIGYAIGVGPRSGPAQLYWLYVHPDHRGSNIGLSLLSRMLRIQARHGADQVFIATHDHRRYYERQGFKFLKKTTTDGVEMDVLTFKLAP